ncbi:subtilisin-like protease SBT3.18 [Magnolia sinica]|uniref:subtilisin-like protease SBT3.18 n=1 Tax=Magnolia sinica TaxID=86752 RepID=UPI002658B316|nr:subtilisin-like protease SBT3.18 [Magnolia sinica]
MSTFFQWFWGLSLSLSLYYIHSASTSHVHIVYLGLSHAHDPILTTKSHVQLLSNVFASEDDAKEAMLYSYKHSFSGFAARLNSTQATTLASMEGVISVFESKTLQLHTTRSWDFMGLTLNHGKSTPLQLAYGDDIVVGVFDTGIWPESKSFKEDLNTGPIPRSWKGKCVKGEDFKRKVCNRKLIGARYYVKGFEALNGPLNKTANMDYRSPRDPLGHGTHIASTAVGSVVENACFSGFGCGTARGGAPRARLAVYKICWNLNFEGRCTEADILAAYDAALHDGVNVISSSLGLTAPLPSFFSSATDIGSFHASQLGVSVVFSAGNSGPEPSLVENVSPWGTCVGATSMDRTFPTQILLGNHMSITGQGFIDQNMTKDSVFELVFSHEYFHGGVCDFYKWNNESAKGKVILCFYNIGSQLTGNAALGVFAAQGVAMIYATPTTKDIANVDFIPTVYIDVDQGTQIMNYILSHPSPQPTVQIFPSETAIGQTPAPSVAYFSSRGPNSVTPNILKPDISAPGVNILAAWSPKTPPAILPLDDRSVDWNFQSGTSMSCPHVSGIVALLKSAHPDWSPAAIKSAMMTTAYTRDTTWDEILAGGSPKPADPFDIGAGHVDPLKAINPGLVYDVDTRDYVLFLCSLGYTQNQIKSMVLSSPRVDTRCPKCGPSDMDLNYPAIAVSDLRCTVTIKRTLRNVGPCPAIYFVSVVKPEGVRVVVWPRILIFSPFKQKITYYVTLTPLKHSQGRYDFGKIVWSDGHHHVTSPLIVRVNNNCEAAGHVGLHASL